MNILFNACSAAIFTRTSIRAVKSSIGAFSALSWKTGVGFTATRKVDSDLFFKQICIHCYSSKKSRGESSSSQKSDLTAQMKEDRDGFFVVRKGNLICDPSVSVYKGYAMPKDTEEYLLSCGLKNALYSIRATDLTEDLFGTLVPCPF
ncbi:hypothetical protein RDI58_009623 [Solanum bulbocastanum]|uniref:Uncharacterized protein n=1 Tax=Solanum bulbocastanum TaxID=147425 RepID=A0AAN8YFJ0_SOLBU